jgi:hypothetical protein
VFRESPRLNDYLPRQSGTDIDEFDRHAIAINAADECRDVWGQAGSTRPRVEMAYWHVQ